MAQFRYSRRILPSPSFVIMLWAAANILFPGISAAQAPANDECSGATVISSLPYSTSQNTRLAIVNPSDPVLTCADGGGGKTVWFTYTPISTQVVRISTLGSTPTADYDIALAVFTGACGSLVEVRCNDDAGGTRQSEISMQVNAGVTYLIHVAEWNGGGPIGGVPTGGDLVFNVTVGQIPPLAKGPKTGSIPSGVTVNTDNFPLGPFMGEPEAKIIEHPEGPSYIAPKNLRPPKGPEGSNYIEDRGLAAYAATAGRPTVLQSFQGIPDQGQSIPPDPIMAVGPNHVMACVNSRFRILDKNGTILKTITVASWFASATPGSDYSDPQIIYDHYENRWVIVWWNVGTNKLLISVSDDNSPIGTWYNWALPASSAGDSLIAGIPDYPQLGFDNQALYVTVRQFTPDGVFSYSSVRIIGKAQLYANTAGPVTWTDFWDLRDPDEITTAPDAVRPTEVFGTPGVYFLVNGSPFRPGTYFTVRTISNPLTNPTMTAVNIPVVAYSSSPLADQLGGGTPRIDVGSGSRNAIRSRAIYRDSSLWAVQDIASGPGNAYTAIHYVRLNPFTSQNLEDVALGLEGYWYYYPTIMVDQDKNVVLGYSRSGTNEYVGAFTSGRKNTDPPGLSPSVAVKLGEANYVKTFGGTRNRWGDYNGIGLDPVDGNAVWMFTEYAASPANTWGTWVSKVKIDTAQSIFMNVPRTSLTLRPTEIGPGQRSDTATVIIQSNGADTLIISNISGPSSPFVLINAPALPWRIPTGSGTFGINFMAVTTGNYTDSLIITSNDPLNPTVTVRVSATAYVVNSAVRGIMYATTGTGASSRLFTVDTSTATVTPVGAYGSGYTQAVSVRVHPTTHKILGLIPTSANANYVLARINSAGGDAHPSLAVKGVLLKGMAFAGDTLYVANIAGPVYRVNMTTGDTTRVATTGLSIGGLDFHPLTGELWASTRTNANIYKINLPAGTPTLVGNTGLGTTADIMFDAKGNLFAVTGTGATTNQLIRINTTTGAGTLIGSMGISSVQGIAMYPDTLTVGVEEIASGTPPTQYTLDQNYPNPFNPTTQIRYGVPEESRITLAIFNELGQEVRRLVDGIQPPGNHSAIWNGTNSAGEKIASGVYLYKLEAVGANGATFVQTKKLLLLK